MVKIRKFASEEKLKFRKMNYLAHSYLSFNHPDILVGNMISDFIKGRKKLDYTPGVQQGIQLHRDIDTFTDAHPATKTAKTFLQPAVGPYAGAFVDVVYDHFLANDTKIFTAASLEQHAQATYVILQNNYAYLPLSMQGMLPYMQAQNWLYNYKHTSGINHSFNGVVRRAAYLDDASGVYALFEQHYAQLQQCYDSFFGHVKTFALSRVQMLSNS